MATGADIQRICTEAVKSVILRGDKELSADDLEVAVGKYI
jgi:ATP-dependent 26S proteasome regulatory subunit